MLKVSKFTVAYPMSPEKKRLIDEVKTKGCIAAFLTLYEGLWTIDPNYLNHPDYFFEAGGIDPNKPCWLWLGSTDKNGYGEMKWDGIKMDVQRVSYQCFKGPIGEQDPKSPYRLEVDHRCQNSLCFNPTHLRLIPKARNGALVKLRERYHLQQPKSERDLHRQQKFLTEMYAKEVRLKNELAKFEAKAAKAIDSSRVEQIRSDLEGVGINRKYWTSPEDREIPIEDRSNDISAADLNDPEDPKLQKKLDEQWQDPRLQKILTDHGSLSKQSL